jgi:hypothetical protein
MERGWTRRFSGVGGMIPGPAHSQTSFGSRRLWSAPEHPAVPEASGLGPAGPHRLVQRTSFVATASYTTWRSVNAATRATSRCHRLPLRPRGRPVTGRAGEDEFGGRDPASRSSSPNGADRSSPTARPHPGPITAWAARPPTTTRRRRWADHRGGRRHDTSPTRPPRTAAPTGAPGGVASPAAGGTPCRGSRPPTRIRIPG